MFTMNCTRHAKNPEDLKRVHEYVRIHAPGGYKYKTGAGMYHAPMIDTADENRRAHLYQPMELHDPDLPRTCSRHRKPRIKGLTDMESWNGV